MSEENHRAEWTILYIDDDEDDFFLVREMLAQSQGHRVRLTWAASFEDGRSRLTNERYDAILVDYDLGARTGIELIQEFSARVPSPFILYTGRGGYAVDAEAMEAGASLYITKGDFNSLTFERFIRYAIERKRLEKQLENSLQQKAAILESIQDGLISIDRDWRFTSINSSAAQTLGFTPEELIGRNLWESFPSLLLDTLLETNYRKVMEERIPVQFESKSGVIGRWFNISVYPSSEGISVYWQDISERKRTEEALKISERKFSLLFENAAYASGLSKLPEGVLVDVNQAWIKLFGYSKEEALGRTTLDMGINPDFETRKRILSQLQATGSARDQEITLFIKSGKPHTALVNIDIIEIDGEQYALNIVEDITERKQAERAFLTSEEKFSKAFHSNPAAMTITRISDGLYTDANEAFSQLVGFRQEEIVGHSSVDVGGFSQEVWQEILHKLQEEGKVCQQEFLVTARDGKLHHVLFSLDPIDIGGEPSILSTMIDITERKRAEEALRENEEKLQLALIAGRAGAWSWDLKTDQLEWSDEYYRIFGFEPGSIKPSAEAGLSRIHPEDLPVTQSLIKEALSRGEPVDTIHRVIWPDGSIHWVRDLARVFYGEDGKPMRKAGISMDITAQKQAELEIEAANKRNYEIIESIQDAFYSLDKQGRFTYVNQKAAVMWGKKSGDLLGKNIWEVFPGGVKTEAYPKIQQALEYRLPAHFETYSAHIQQWVDIHLYPTEQGISVFFTDISERKRAEEALRESEQKYRALFHSSMDAVFLTRPDGTVEAANTAACNMLGRSEQEIREIGLQGVLDTSDPKVTAIAEEREVTGRVQKHEAMAIRKDGQKFPVEIDSVILPGDPVRSFVIMREITERKEAEKALRESEARLEARTHELEIVQDAMPAYLWIAHDPEAREITGNRATIELMRMAHGESLSKTSSDPEKLRHFRMMKDGQEIPNEEFPVQKVAASGVPIRDYEFDLVFDDGEVRHLLGNVSPLRDEQGNPAGAVSAFIDITPRKEFQRRLQESESRFKVALASAPISVFTIDLDYRITWMYDPHPDFQLDQVLGKRFDEIAVREEGKDLIALLQSAIDTGHFLSGEIDTISGGKPTTFAYYLDPIRDKFGKIEGLACAGYDITDRKQVEKDLQQYAEQLKQSNNALQDFAFVAAHDLQEPLRKIHSFGSLLEKEYANTLGETGRNYIARMSAASERMSTMLEGLLAYSRVTSQGNSFVEVDLNQVAADVLADLEFRIRDTSGTVEVCNLPVIQADPLQMRQLFENLIINALKYHQTDVPPIIKITCQPVMENQIQIQVADNGIGFENKHATHIFKPFVRVEGRVNPQEGSGIGLAICKRIVERHGGSISASSKPEEGSTFTIILPKKQSIEYT